jgi:hypothetical protein
MPGSARSMPWGSARSPKPDGTVSPDEPSHAVAGRDGGSAGRV